LKIQAAGMDKDMKESEKFLQVAWDIIQAVISINKCSYNIAQ
jgi:hypothetical protein